MKYIKYFIQFIIIIFLFILFKIIGLKISSFISGTIFTLIGPFFRSNDLSHNNLNLAFPEMNKNEKNKILKKMWFNYGIMFVEYIFIKELKKAEKIIIENQKILEDIKVNSEQVIFISGHFNNFELMAMHLEKSGINLAAIYRPLNNIFLNPIMEYIRKKHICKIQIKKGISGTKNILKKFNEGASIALMIDQRVSQGIKCDFFNKKAFTTTIPAQFVKKYGTKIVPIYIERIQGSNFKLKINHPIKFDRENSLESITLKLNQILESMIIKKPEQWIWTHNRWK
jgi:KDO2-lipid IV(A) lauroyltransferase